MKRVLVLTKNKLKFEEYKAVFADTDIELISLLDVKEQNYDLVYNSTKYKRVAEYNALAGARKYHLPVIAEVFGLEIPSLKKWPGIKTHILFEENTLTLVKQLIKNASDTRIDKTAEYVSGFALASPYNDGTLLGSIETRLLGSLKFPPEGKEGFGFDDIFYVTKYRLVLGRVSLEKKLAISHRTKALLVLKAQLIQYFKGFDSDDLNYVDIVDDSK